METSGHHAQDTDRNASPSVTDTIPIMPLTSTPQERDIEDQQETNSNLLAKNDWLQAQIDSQKTEILAARTKDDGQQNNSDIDILSELRKKLLDEYIEKDKKELIIKRIQMGNFLVKELFEKSTEECADKAEKERREVRVKYLKELLEKQCRLVSGIMTNLKAMEPKRKRLVELKKRSFEKMKENRRQMEIINERENQQQSDSPDRETKDLLEDLDKTLQKIAIARNTLQAFIIGSGINWAQDPQMQELVLEMGKKLEL